jgi:hypothetical protein
MGYSPTLGRFLERDPEEYVDGMNLYQSELSNPTNHLDPLGTTVEVNDVGPYGALGHWRNGGGEPVVVKGHDFIDHVKSIPEVRQQLDWFKQRLEKKAASDGAALKPCDCKTVTLTQKNMSATMTGFRWGAFGTIYHDVTGTVTVCKTSGGHLYESQVHLHVTGHDTYHNFETTPWGFRHVWYGINAVAGTIRDLYPHAPTAYNIYWSWDEPDPPPEIGPAR